MTCSSSCRRVKLRTRRSDTMNDSSEVSSRSEVLGPGEERGLRPLGANWRAEVQSRQGGGRPPGARGADAVNRHGVILSAGPPEGSPRFTSRSPALAHGAPPGRDPRPGRPALHELAQTLRARLAWETAELLRDRFAKIPERHRPHFTPAQRFRVLEIRSLLAWNAHETARLFLLCTNTVLNWENLGGHPNPATDGRLKTGHQE